MVPTTQELHSGTSAKEQLPARAWSLLSELFEKHAILFGTLAYLIPTAIRNSNFLFEGRFWAEEGRVFFPDLYRAPVKALFTYMFNGHLELITNITVWCASWVDILYAPLVTGYLSLIFQLPPIWLLLIGRSQLGLTGGTAVLLTFLSGQILPAAEISMNAINLHFHFALLAALILLLDTSTLPRWVPTRSLLLVSGLSGIPANFLIPCFALKVVLTRKRHDLEHFLLLMATGLYELYLLKQSNFAVGERTISFEWKAIVYSYLTQVIVTPAAPTAKSASRVVNAIFAWEDQGRFRWKILMSAFVASLLLVADILRRRTKLQIAALCLSVFVAACMVTTSQGGGKMALVLGFGGRYFYVPGVLFLLAVLSGATRRDAMSWAFVLLIVFHTERNLDWYFSGPSWRESLAHSAKVHDENTVIWPGGWWMPLPKPR